MELYIKMDKAIERTLKGYQLTIERLRAEANISLESGDYSEAIKLQYDINLISNAYDVLRGEHDSYYKKAVYHRPMLDNAIIKDSLADALEVAKIMGISQSMLCDDLQINKGNLSSHLKGKIPYKRENKIKIFNYVRGLLY